MKLVTALEYWAHAKTRVAREKYDKLFHSPRALVDETIQRAVGCSVSATAQITKGETNEVYSVQLKDGREIIVRISRREKSRFQTERWAIEQCTKAGVPVPSVIAVETTEHDGKPLSISIESKMPGITLDEAAKNGLSDADMAKLLREAGHLLSLINSVGTAGFGELDQDGNGKYDSVRRMFSQNELNRGHFIKVARSIDLDRRIIEKALNLLYQQSMDYPAISAHLIHNDFAPKNILICGNKVSGILDFECSQGGDPTQEFAYWQFFVEERYSLQHLMDGYDNKSLFGEEFRQRSFVWRLYTALTNLDRFAKRKYKRGVEYCKTKLVEDMNHAA